ncbi:hypothetical protein RHMOL_Rhmol01G0213800 [Rhododendron molle]|uniref:Uncharacterized protein n=1 Tax=Rhododendron molle TaxID=49168 RepID=A0ACC0Q5H5_RHOML|nr:hypothetical protein RHMOL_Rhmol01G0213800 [Rhododendron molle]
MTLVTVGIRIKRSGYTLVTVPKVGLWFGALKLEGERTEYGKGREVSLELGKEKGQNYVGKEGQGSGYDAPRRFWEHHTPILFEPLDQILLIPAKEFPLSLPPYYLLFPVTPDPYQLTEKISPASILSAPLHSCPLASLLRTSASTASTPHGSLT